MFTAIFRIHLSPGRSPMGVILLWSLLLLFTAAGSASGMESVPRKVMVLYDSGSGMSEMENLIYQDGQTILNYYGLLTEYRDINRRPFPDDAEMAAYLGVITVFLSEIQTDPKGYLSWLIQQIQQKRKVIVIGRLGVRLKPDRPPDVNGLIHRVQRMLGFEIRDDFTANQSVLRYVHKDKKGVEFERKYPPFPKVYERIVTSDKSTKIYLSIRRTDQPESTSAMIFVNASGGYAHEDYIFWMDPSTFRRQWYVNPFCFFTDALSLGHVPIPDPTTLNGMRVAFSHIDADGFVGFSRVDKKQTCAEVIRDRVLKKYNFPVTVSVIVGEIDPKAVGSPAMVRLARDIFRLPNVEPASHSYSHPFYWDLNDDREAEKYEHQYGIFIPGYTHDSKKEIDYSMTYITEKLAPPGKPCKIMLWSGNCLPTEADIARCDASGYVNMNGGDTLFDDVYDSYTSVAPYYRKVGSRYQIMTGQANENILTNLWTGPYYGFRNIVTTMKKTGTPRRIAPIDIYYHFYSGEYASSLKAVEDVHQWVLRQDVAPVFTSQYVQMVDGYLKAKIFHDGTAKYIIRDYGACLTFRLDEKQKRPDMNRSINVLGFSVDSQGLYISLLPSKEEATLVLSDPKVPSPGASLRPRVRRASGWVTRFDVDGNQVTIDFKGFGSGTLELSGLHPNRTYALSGNGLNGSAGLTKSDEDGVLTIAGVKTGTVEITW